MVSLSRALTRVDALVGAAVLLCLVGAWFAASHAFDAAWMDASACQPRRLPEGLLACATTAPWLHLSVTHALLNLAAIALLWRHLRACSASEVACSGCAGSLLGMVSASLLFGLPVVGASALVHGWLGLALVRHRSPLSAIDLLAVSGLLALGATAATWTGHLVAAIVGASATVLLASNRAPR